MTGRARIFIGALGGLLVLFGLLIEFRPDLAAAMMLPFARPSLGPLVLGGLLLASTLFEGRYRRRGEGIAGPGWEQTGETFRDEESGRWLDVWFNRQNGERRYLPRDRAD
ncbi:MAG: hypothetical protein KGK11_11620 [Sphingomonadales bacterium]|nr:hypothetical protein [Sphingomonadales bacterium]